MNHSVLTKPTAAGRVADLAICNHCEERIYKNQGNLPLLQLASLDRAGIALDVGCGAGDNARILVSRGWSVFGITLSQIEQVAAEAVCSKVWIHDLDEGLPDESGQSYGLIVLSHVLEHLRNPEALLVQISRLLTPDGQVAIALPNVLNWHQRLLFLVGRFEYTEQGIMDNTHMRFYSFASARRMLEACGFQVIAARAAGSILPWGPIRKRLPSFTAFVDRLFCALRPGLFGRQLLYIAIAK